MIREILGTGARVLVLDQRHRAEVIIGRRSLQEPLTDRAVLQVGPCPTRHATRAVNLRSPSDTEHLVNRQNSAQKSLR